MLEAYAILKVLNVCRVISVVWMFCSRYISSKVNSTVHSKYWNYIIEYLLGL